MSATERRKGANAERAVTNHLRHNGWPDARRYLAGDGNQPGDIDAIPGVILEVKNQTRYDLAGWMRQAIAEAHPHRLPVVVMKPKGVTDVGSWWAVLRFDDLLDLLRDETTTP